jgi:prepilin-type N-terminal cleavage/methylation domain-containing protein
VARSGEEVRRRNVTTARAHGAGFTLMELLIAVAVIALLAAIALPAYQDQLLKARRSEGKTALLKALQLEERHYTSNGTYIADLGPLFGGRRRRPEIRRRPCARQVQPHRGSGSGERQRSEARGCCSPPRP